MDDKRIIELFFDRDEKALKLVKQKYGGLCFAAANSILKDRGDAEECVNDTYFAAWNSIPPQRPNKLSAFLSKIARNKAIDRYQHKHRKKRNTDLDLLWSELTEEVAAPDVTEALDKRLVEDLINSYLHELPESKAGVFVLRYYFFFTESEISKRTGFSYSKVASMLYRMKNELRGRLQKEGIDV